MAQTTVESAPAIHGLITEDDTPVDNLPSEKQQRLLTEPLYSSWAGPGDGRPFLAAANVGIFALARNPAIVPDMFLSLDVQVADDWWRREHRSYFLWEFGKPPDLVLEIVSNTVGGEEDEKKQKYARMRVSTYVIYDPLQQVMAEVLTIYRLGDFGYERQDSPLLPALKLGLTLWEGTFEDKRDCWLRWTDEHGVLIPTGKERAEQAEQRVEQERQRAEAAQRRADEEHQQADVERQRAEEAQQRAEEAQQRAEEAQQRAEEAQQRAAAERQRAERLAALLRQAGIDPQQL
ncbi:MAG: Uma2 family endonuclease [Candidatus Tectimicrobiota bacterium]